MAGLDIQDPCMLISAVGGLNDTCGANQEEVADEDVL